MKIRRIHEKELSEFYQLFLEILKDGFPEYPPELIAFFAKKDFSYSVIKNKFVKEGSLILVAEDNQKLAGFLMADKLYGGVAYCCWLGVLKSRRGKGIGGKLLAAWEREVIKQKGHKLLLLTQSIKNRDFYQKYGFEEEGFERVSWFGLDCWLFGKVIADPKPEVFLR